MFNNSTSVMPSVPSWETPSVDRFDRWISCMLWHLIENNTSFEQADADCFLYEAIEESTAGAEVIYGLTGTLILIPNAVMLLAIVGTRKLHKALYFYFANLAVSDILAGIGVLCRYAAWVGKGAGISGMYALMNVLTLLTHSMVMSALALALMSIDSYVAVCHPIYFHTHAHNAKRNAGITIASSWFVLSLLDFSPSMGWNCLDVDATECYSFFSQPFFVLVLVMIFLFGIIMVFTNVSVYMTLKKRRKNRLGEAGGVQPVQGNNPAQNAAGNQQPQNANVAQNEADRKFKKSVQKARTVLIHVIVAFVCLIAALVLAGLCSSKPELCPVPSWPHFFLVLLTLSAVINPIVTIVRMHDLKKAIRDKILAIFWALVKMIRGNRVNPQDAHHQPADGNVPIVQVGAAGGSEQITASTSQPTAGTSESVGTQARNSVLQKKE